MSKAELVLNPVICSGYIMLAYEPAAATSIAHCCKMVAALPTPQGNENSKGKSSPVS